jgi:hypothetical protein
VEGGLRLKAFLVWDATSCPSRALLKRRAFTFQIHLFLNDENNDRKCTDQNRCSPTGTKYTLSSIAIQFLLLEVATGSWRDNLAWIRAAYAQHSFFVEAAIFTRQM